MVSISDVHSGSLQNLQVLDRKAASHGSSSVTGHTITELESRECLNPARAQFCSPAEDRSKTRSSWKNPAWLCPLCDWSDAKAHSNDYDVVQIHIFEQ